MKIIHGDCAVVLKELGENNVDAIVTDPPYELGFMGKSWDSTGIANNVELWKECLRVLKPGGYLLAFSGTRTYHRMASAIEDAGFEVRDMIEWVYGSGFPKSLNIGKAVDKLQGNEREWISENPNKASEEAELASAGKSQSGRTTHPDITKCTSEWEGWGTALKPAHEPICMARKPLAEKTVAENCLKWGTGGINIDESRVDFVSEEDRKESTTKNQHADFGTKPMTNNNVYGDYSMIQPKNFNPTGRFPANLIHDNSEEVRECFPETSTGNASRFFKSVQTSLFEDAPVAPIPKGIIYTAKASKSERNAGCEDLEEKQSVGGGGGIGDYLNDVNSASGKFGSEKAPAKNNHPTVKPIALMEYLIKMVTREGALVLDPFAGSGTTGIACKNTGRNCTLIEKDPEYIAIIKSRV